MQLINAFSSPFMISLPGLINTGKSGRHKVKCATSIKRPVISEKEKKQNRKE